jgi:ureidoglycolate lyase
VVTKSGEARTFTVTAEVVTPESFQPFGEMLTTSGSPLPHVYGDTMDVYRAGRLESDTPVEYILTRYRLREFRVQFLERHHRLTQTFIPLEGNPFAVAVAAADAGLENGVPRVEDVHAFVVPGDAAVNLRRGTWHEVPFPLVDGGMTLVTSHAGVTDGWAELDETREIAKLDEDEEKRNVLDRTGVRLLIELPERYTGAAK